MPIPENAADDANYSLLYNECSFAGNGCSSAVRRMAV
jgi:hypothetical protein